MSQFQWQSRKIQAGTGGTYNGKNNPSQNVVALNELKFTLHQRLIEELDPNKLEGIGKDKARDAVEQAARTLIAQEMPGIVGTTRDELVSAVADEVLGFGPLEPLLRDNAISEVMVNAPDTVFYEKEGRLYLSSVRFRDDNHIMRIVERIVAPLGRRVDESSPMVDARLPDGSRVNVIIPPVAPKSPTITIRKFRTDKMTMNDLVATGALTQRAGGVLPRLRAGQAQHPHLRRYRLRQDDPAQRALGVHSGHGAHRHDRGPDGAAAPAGSRRHARGAPAVARRQGRSHAARPGAQLAAHAPRPHHRR